MKAVGGSVHTGNELGKSPTGTLSSAASSSFVVLISACLRRYINNLLLCHVRQFSTGVDYQLTAKSQA